VATPSRVPESRSAVQHLRWDRGTVADGRCASGADPQPLNLHHHLRDAPGQVRLGQPVRCQRLGGKCQPLGQALAGFAALQVWTRYRGMVVRCGGEFLTPAPALQTTCSEPPRPSPVATFRYCALIERRMRHQRAMVACSATVGQRPMPDSARPTPGCARTKATAAL